MDADHDVIVATVARGGTVDEAAVAIGRPVASVRRWLTQGRKNPEGPWGELARRVEVERRVAAQGPAASGDQERAANRFIAGLPSSKRDDPRAQLLLGLARKVDWCERANSGAAAMSMERLAARYAALLTELQPVTNEAFAGLVEAMWSGVHEDSFRWVLEQVADGSLSGDEAAEKARERLRQADLMDGSA